MTTTSGTGRIMAMILAAGAGTRAKHLTDPGRNKFPMAKPRFPILQTPVMDHWLRGLARASVKEVFANLWSNPDTIKSYYAVFPPEKIKIKFYEENELMGTMGSAVYWPTKGEGIKDGDTLFVLSGDIATNADLNVLLQEHQRVGADLTVVFYPVPWSQVKEYGTAAFKGLPEKRAKGQTETNKNYDQYLVGYQQEVDKFVRENAYQAIPVTDFKEKEGPETCCSNSNNASIYILSGAFVKALEKKKITPIDDTLPDPFYDFGKHGFKFALQEGFKFYGINLPKEVYWKDIGDPAKYWLAIMDALDGRFDRSMLGLPPNQNEPITFIHPQAYVNPKAELTAPFFIAENAEVQAYAKVGPYAVVSSHAKIGSSAEITGSAMIETAHFDEGDQKRELLGSGVGGAQAKRSLIAGGTIYADQAAQNNLVIIRPDGRTRFTSLGMDPTLSKQRIEGVKVEAVEAG